MAIFAEVTENEYVVIPGVIYCGSQLVIGHNIAIMTMPYGIL